MNRAKLESILKAHGFDLAELIGSEDRPDLEALAAKWIPRLRLDDWTISLAYVPNLMVGGAPAHGSCLPFVERRTAAIEINDPATAYSDDERPTIEEVLLHELLHVASAELARSGSVVAEEQLVHVVTTNLMNAERETVIRAMAVRSPTQKKTRKASVMNNNLNELVARITRLEAEIQDLVDRVDALEGGAAPAAKKAPSRASALGPRRDRSSPEVAAMLDRRMGLTSKPSRIERRGNVATFPVMTPEQARRATRGAA